MASVKAQLLSLFKGRDLGNVTQFNGVTFRRSSTGLSLNLRNYWAKLLSIPSLAARQPAAVPISKKVSTSDCPDEVIHRIRKQYWRLIGFLTYGVTRVRLDLVYSVSALARVMSNPAQVHLDQIKHCFSYIASTINEELHFPRDESVQIGQDFRFTIWPDSSHADDDVTMRSTGGWFMFLQPGQGAVAAKSQLRRTVTTSSTESEYCTYSDAAKEAMYAKQFIEELGLFKSVSFDIMVDSQPAQNALKKDVTHSRFKHILISYHYIREVLSSGFARIVKVSTHDQIGDAATKPLSENLVRKFRALILGRPP